MALNDKNILITPNIGSTNEPKIDFVGASTNTGPSTITATVYPTNNGTLSFDGTAGNLFAISNNLSSGSIFSVNPISGIPIIDVNADRTIALNPYGGNTGIGLTNPQQKLHIFSSSTLAAELIEAQNSSSYASLEVRSGVGTTAISGALYASSLENATILRNNSNTTGAGLGLAGTQSAGADLVIFRATRNVVIGDNPQSASQTGTASQKLQVQSGAYISGNLGIGITNPTSKLEVSGATSFGSTTLSNAVPLAVTGLGETYSPTGAISSKYLYFNAGTVANLLSSPNSSNTGCLIDFNAYNSANNATGVYIGGVAGPSGNGPANFVIGRRTGVQSWAESLRVDTSGNVGIGTINPSLGRLDVSTGGAGPTRIAFSQLSDNPYIDYYRSTGIGANFYGFRTKLSLADYVFENAPSATLGSHTFTERMRITSAGLVGIGTNAPTTNLSVAASTNATLRLSGNATSYGELIFSSLGGGWDAYGASIEGTGQNTGIDLGCLIFKTSTGGVGNTRAERLRITSAGLVGIGTNAPGYVLDVGGANAGIPTINCFGPAADNNWAGGIRFASNNGTSVTAQIRASTGGLLFDYGGSERFRCDSSGRLLVGTSVSRSNFYNTTGLDNNLQIEGTTHGGSGISIIRNQSSNAAHIELASSGGTTVGSYTTVSSTASIGALSFQGADGSEFVEAANIFCAIDGAPGINSMPGRIVFGTTASGASTPTERARITSSGNFGVGTNNPTARMHLVLSGDTPNPVLQVTRANNAGGGVGNDEIGIAVTIPNTYNNAGIVYGVRSYAAHNLGSTHYAGHFVAGGSAYSSGIGVYAKTTHTDTNGPGFQPAILADAYSTIGVSNSGYAVGLQAQTNDYVNNVNLVLTSNYTGALAQSLVRFERNSSIVGYITCSTTAVSYLTSPTSGLFGAGSNEITVNTNSVERLRINSSGNVGVGVTNPTSKLHINGSISLSASNQYFYTNNISKLDQYFPLETYVAYNNVDPTVTWYGGTGSKLVYNTSALSLYPSISVGLDFGLSSNLWRYGYFDGPIFVGSGTSTGTANQRLQVTGGAYVSGNLGIGITNLLEYGTTSPGNYRIVATGLGTFGYNFLTGNNTLSSSSKTGYQSVMTSLAVSGGKDVVINGVTSGRMRINIAWTNVTGNAVGYMIIEGSTYINSPGSGYTLSNYRIVDKQFQGGTFYGVTENPDVAVTSPAANNSTDKVTLTIRGADGQGSLYATVQVEAWGSYWNSANAISLSTPGTTTSTSYLSDVRTFWTSNIERARIDASGNLLIGAATSTGTVSQPLQVTGGAYVSGNVGVGVTNPTQKLDVFGNIRAVNNTFKTSGDQITSISFSVGGSVAEQTLPVAQINGINRYSVRSQYDGDLSFNVASGGGLVEVGRFAYNGNLGIGTTRPLQNLHVQGNLLVAAGSSTAQHITQKAYEVNNGTLSWEGSAGQLFSITNNLTSGSIFSVNDVSGIPSIDVDVNGAVDLAPYSGNVGVGTTNPISKLHIVGNSLINGISTYTGQIISTQANSTADGGGQIYLNGATGNRIDFNTNGVAAPTFTTRSVGTKIVLYPGVAASAVDFGFGIESSTLWSSVGTTSNQFKWYAGTTNIATLSGVGSFSMGRGVSGATATPARLDLGNSYSNGSTRDKCKIYLYNSGTEQYGFGVGSTSDVQYHTNGTHDFYTANALTARIDNTGLITISGPGIKFPAAQVTSADPNTLDDYEEGTFTPTIIGTSVAGTATYTFQNARYTKIGRLVQIEIYVAWNSGNGSGSLRISGLPFAIPTSTTYPALALGASSNVALTAGYTASVYCVNNTSQIGIYQFPTGGGGATIDVPYDGAGELIIAGCYSV